MPYFVIYALDKAGVSDIRSLHRPAHRERLREPDSPDIWVHSGGPLEDDNGQMIGSMLIIEAPTKATVETFIDEDPYSIAGLYECVDIRHFKWGLGQPAEKRFG